MILANISSHHLRKIFNVRVLKCKYCKYYSIKSSEDIRNTFLNYFVRENDHKYISSSPVVPFCDPTVAFVNAGMNQFKGVFLGQFSPPSPRVANSQKCVRIGGKHSDLNIVGTDGSHHTFFEMLGNWSFGDYYKLEACQMAWTLLTGPYGIDPSKLIVTYFGGDKYMGLEPDLECRDIWRKIGVQENNLVPGSTLDNFWEMGAVGPCGPCTEIYYKRDDNSLLEIWNIVFIQFNRESESSISKLPKCHVDTGMGLERVTALLQNKSSNYDTDLFLPLLQAIHKKSNGIPAYNGQFGEHAQLDTAYRTLADHSRMISICLADGVFPCRNLRLRNIIRKAISLSNNMFKSPGLLSALYDEVSMKLGPVYPELLKKEREAKQIINHEEQTFVALEKSVNKQRKELLEKYPETINLSQDLTPGLAEGYKQFKLTMKSTENEEIPGFLAFKLYDTFGLDEEMINKIAHINHLSVDMDTFRQLLLEHKSKHKSIFTESANSSTNMSLNLKVDRLLNDKTILTEDKYKYDYSLKSDGTCNFPIVQSQLMAILTDKGDLCTALNVDTESEYHLIFDKTNFYCEEGGQSCDVGKIHLSNGATFNVQGVSKIRGLVLHSGKFINISSAENKVSVGDSAQLMIDQKNRLQIMQHHTATHLLNAAIKKVLSNSVTCQLSSKVTESGLVLDLAVYGEKLSTKTINDAQELVRMACSKPTPVKTSILDSQDLMSVGDVTVVPGEIYPEIGLRLVEIDLLGAESGFSRELCCGTHVPSTDLIENFCITGVRGAGGHAPTIKAVAGSFATRIYTLANEGQLLLQELEYDDIPDQKEFLDKINNIRNEMNALCKGDGAPHGIRAECFEALASAEKKIKDSDTKTLVDLVGAEMKTVMAEMTNKPFVVHFLVCSYLLEPSILSLTTAIECGAGKPILILGCAGGIIKATCHVPQNFVSSNFTAEKWIQSIIPTFGTHVIPPSKNQDPNTIAHMKGKKVSLINCESLVADAIKRATIFAETYLQTNNDGQDQKQWLQEDIKKICDSSS